MARELGGRRRAQLVAALATATSPQVMAAFHLLSTAAFDMFFWAAITFVVLRLLRIGDQRLWIVIGAVSGLGLLNKLNVLFLLIGIGAGLVFAGRGRELLNRYVVAGAVIAAAIWLPNIVWNAQHDWAALSMLHSLHAENSTLGASIAFIPSQLVVAGIVQAFIWIAGLRFLLRSTFARPLALGFVVVLALFTIGGAKPYYLAGMYFVLLAAGGVSVEHQLEQSVPAARVRGVVAWLLVGAVIALPFTEPVIPQHSMPSSASLGNINKDLSATVGWQAFVGQIASVARTLPAGERSTLVVFTGDYGAAGAVDLWGERYGLRDAISGHNSYWWWGPGRARDGATTIAVDLPRSYLRTIFSDVTPAGVVATPDGIWSEERGAPIWICRGQNTPWARAWPAARHYG
jgi:4-amino-4-deoxy-L-arabinose transferase-like glycosyltransferase